MIKEYLQARQGGAEMGRFCESVVIYRYYICFTNFYTIDPYGPESRLGIAVVETFSSTLHSVTRMFSKVPVSQG